MIAMQLAKGLILLLLLYFVAYNLNMKTVRFIMQNVVATGVLALVIVFQPELRRMLEHVAQTKLNKLNIFQSSQDKDSELTGSLERVDFGDCQRLRNPFQNQDRCSDCL